MEELLKDMDDLVIIEEPDDKTLSLEAEDLETLVKEEPLGMLDNPDLMMELSEDPVRLYLKEIGGIDLLDTDKEFWLSTRLESVRRIDVLSRGHPISRRGVSSREASAGNARNIYRALYDELETAWKRLAEDTIRLGHACPDLALILIESQMLRQTWESDVPSYLRAYLDNGLWGRDPLWDGVARNAFTVFLSLYMLPGDFTRHLLIYVNDKGEMPPKGCFENTCRRTMFWNMSWN